MTALAAPAVTVLMTVYNGGAYLTQAIESVLAQTWQDFELLLVDDASTDDSIARIEAYRDPRIRLIRNDRNLGQALSLNHGLESARGRYIARLDQDDLCLPGRLEAQMDVFEDDPDAAAVGTWLYWINAAGRTTGMFGLPINDRGALLSTLLTLATPVAHPTAMIRRDVIEALGGYDVSYAPCEDYELWCRLAQRGGRVRMVTRPLVKIRVHGGQQSVTKLAVQQAQARRAHAALMRGLWPEASTDAAGRLLRLEESCWAEAAAAVQQLETRLARLAARLELNGPQRRKLEQRIAWWIGRGALVALLRGHRDGWPVYRFAWRHHQRPWPSVALAAYPLAWVASPCLSPRGRAMAEQAARAVAKRRYAVLLMLQRAARLGHSGPGHGQASASSQAEGSSTVAPGTLSR